MRAANVLPDGTDPTPKGRGLRKKLFDPKFPKLLFWCHFIRRGSFVPIS